MLSSLAVLSTLTSWLVTARPMSTVALVRVVLSAAVQFDPSLEYAAVIVEPMRARRSQTGVDTVPGEPSDIIDVPADVRVIHSSVPFGQTSKIVAAAFGD